MWVVGPSVVARRRRKSKDVGHVVHRQDGRIFCVSDAKVGLNDGRQGEGEKG